VQIQQDARKGSESGSPRRRHASHSVDFRERHHHDKYTFSDAPTAVGAAMAGFNVNDCLTQ
jgi:hypothetical protein